MDAFKETGGFGSGIARLATHKIRRDHTLCRVEKGEDPTEDATSPTVPVLIPALGGSFAFCSLRLSLSTVFGFAIYGSERLRYNGQSPGDRQDGLLDPYPDILA